MRLPIVQIKSSCDNSNIWAQSYSFLFYPDCKVFLVINKRTLPIESMHLLYEDTPSQTNLQLEIITEKELQFQSCKVIDSFIKLLVLACTVREDHRALLHPVQLPMKLPSTNDDGENLVNFSLLFQPQLRPHDNISYVLQNRSSMGSTPGTLSVLRSAPTQRGCQ